MRVCHLITSARKSQEKAIEASYTNPLIQSGSYSIFRKTCVGRYSIPWHSGDVCSNKVSASILRFEGKALSERKIIAL